MTTINNNLLSFMLLPAVLIQETISFLADKHKEETTGLLAPDKEKLRSLCKKIQWLIDYKRQAIALSHLATALYTPIIKHSPCIKKIILSETPLSLEFNDFITTYRKQIQEIEICYSLQNRKQYNPHFSFRNLASDYLLSFKLRSDSPSAIHQATKLGEVTLNSPNLTALYYEETYRHSFDQKLLNSLSISHLKQLRILKLTLGTLNEPILNEIQKCSTLTELDLLELNNNVVELDWFNFFTTQKSSLTVLRLSRSFLLTEEEIMAVIPHLKKLQIFDCLGIKYFNDKTLIQLATDCKLESLTLNFSLITDEGFGEFVQKASHLKKLRAEEMKLITSIEPLIDSRQALCSFTNKSGNVKLEEFTSFARLTGLTQLSVAVPILKSTSGNLKMLQSYIDTTLSPSSNSSFDPVKIINNSTATINSSCKQLESPVRLIQEKFRACRVSNSQPQ